MSSESSITVNIRVHSGTYAWVKSACDKADIRVRTLYDALSMCLVQSPDLLAPALIDGLCRLKATQLLEVLRRNQARAASDQPPERG